MRNFFLFVLCLLAACWASPQAAAPDHSTPAMHLDKALIQADGAQVLHVTSTPKTVHGGAFEVGLANPHLIAADVPSVHVRSYMAEGVFSPDRARPCVATDAVSNASAIRQTVMARTDIHTQRMHRSTALRWRDLRSLVASSTTSTWSA